VWSKKGFRKEFEEEVPINTQQKNGVHAVDGKMMTSLSDRFKEGSGWDLQVSKKNQSDRTRRAGVKQRGGGKCSLGGGIRRERGVRKERGFTGVLPLKAVKEAKSGFGW